MDMIDDLKKILNRLDRLDGSTDKGFVQKADVKKILELYFPLKEKASLEELLQVMEQEQKGWV